jgi:hypothetical protein
MAKKNKAKLLVYHLSAPKEILLQRINNRKTSRDASHKPIAKTRIQRNLRIWNTNRYFVGREFQTDKMSVKTVSNEILKDLRKK